MNKSDDKVKERHVCQCAGDSEQYKEWQPPCLTVWEVAEDTGPTPSKTASDGDSQGMRDVTPT